MKKMATKNKFQNKDEFKEEYKRRIIEKYGRSIDEAHPTEKFMVLGEMIRDFASVNWKSSKEEIAASGQKQMYYFSMEFLIGRLLTNNLMNLGIYDIVKEGLAELNIDINELEDLESDAGLGNGGLGRLAACFLDSLASLNLPGHGNCIRYQYGLFKQEIRNNEQVELPDNWLKLGNVWEVRKPKHAVDVKFGGHVDCWMGADGKMVVNHVPDMIVRAVPYDVPIVGCDTKLTNTLRLWSAEVADEAVESNHLAEYVQNVDEINLNVYPDDSTEQGKMLRLRQQYFFVSAGLTAMLRSHLRVYHTLDNLAEKVCVQLNDTHPVLCIPELMRLMMDEYGYGWDQAWDTTCKVMAYTNHTVLSEALEKWPIAYVQKLLPRIYMIIQEIDQRFKYYVGHEYQHPELVEEVAIIKDGQVHMASLAIVGSHSVNGVAALHSKILVEDVMKRFAMIYPGKFNNKTNGITHRRWLLYSNPQLTKLITSMIGDGFKKDPQRLVDLMQYVDNPKIQNAFLSVKAERKQILANYIQEQTGIVVDPHSIFDVQAKRLHAYKRQLLNVMHIIDWYQRMKEDESFTIVPHTFIFAAKAAPSYVFAKEVIKLIHCVADKVNNDPHVSSMMKVVFLPNYGVSMAEILQNAADISEQISTAGKEASGTGNMKFMMNGALTLGTLDGANVEIVERVGFENAEIFGLRADDVALIHKDNMYNVWDKYHQSPTLQRILGSLMDCTFHDDPNAFKTIYNELMFKNDEYLLLADYEAYAHAQDNAQRRYGDQAGWARMCLVNIAQSGYFSSDRTIQEYARDIWDIHPVKIKG